MGIEALIAAGADFIVMPCVTAHYFIPEVKKEISFDFVSLPEEAAKWAEDWVTSLETAGILASSGTLQSKLFHEAFAAQGISLISPDDEGQARLMDAIFGPRGIKAGYVDEGPRETVVALARELVDRGAGAVLAGCTEVPLALRPEDLSVPLIEPMRIAAKACIEKAGYALKACK
jgi:aspartate racemase